jgi:hypothetical protein
LFDPEPTPPGPAACRVSAQTHALEATALAHSTRPHGCGWNTKCPHCPHLTSSDVRSSPCSSIVMAPSPPLSSSSLLRMWWRAWASAWSWVRASLARSPGSCSTSLSSWACCCASRPASCITSIQAQAKDGAPGPPSGEEPERAMLDRPAAAPELACSRCKPSEIRRGVGKSPPMRSLWLTRMIPPPCAQGLHKSGPRHATRGAVWTSGHHALRGRR